MDALKIFSMLYGSMVETAAVFLVTGGLILGFRGDYVAGIYCLLAAVCVKFVLNGERK